MISAGIFHSSNCLSLCDCLSVELQSLTLQVVSSAIVDKYIGESARLIREMFGYARDHQPCIIFMDEIDAIGEQCSGGTRKFLIHVCGS